MASTDLVIPGDLGQLLAERQRITSESDQATGQAAKLEKLAGQAKLPDNVPPEHIDMLTIDNLPPAEISTALTYFEAELRTISSVQQDIEQDNTEIDDILRRARNRTIMLVIAAIIAILVVITIVWVMLRSATL